MRNTANGFTMIEVMIALAATGVIALAIYGGTSQTHKVQRIVEYSQDHYHQINVAFEMLNRDLSSTYLSRHRGPLSEHNTAFIGKDDGRFDSIDFVAFSHTRRYFDSNESDQTEVSYYVAQDEEHSGIMNLVRRASPTIDDNSEEGGQHLVVIHNVEEFDVEYYNIVTKEWVSDWDTNQATKESTLLPTQVRIKLVVNKIRGMGRLNPGDNEYTQVAYGTTIPVPMRSAILVPWFVPSLYTGFSL